MFTAYIYSDCDTDGISETTDIEFETLITPPACDGTFSDFGEHRHRFLTNLNPKTEATLSVFFL